MPKPKKLPKAIPKRLPPLVMDTLFFKHGEAISANNGILEKRIAKAMDTHHVDAITRKILEKHLEDLAHWIETPYDKTKPKEKVLHENSVAEFNALKKFLG